MIPYRIKHVTTGLYYKPSKPYLSKVGKVYHTGNNVLNYSKDDDYIYIISNKRSLIKHLNSLGYKIRWFMYGGHEMCFEIPKSEFEIEYLTDSNGEK